MVGGPPAVVEGQGRKAALLVEGRSLALALHALSIHQQALVEVLGGPGADGRVHPVLLRQHAHRHARLREALAAIMKGFISQIQAQECRGTMPSLLNMPVFLPCTMWEVL